MMHGSLHVPPGKGFLAPWRVDVIEEVDDPSVELEVAELADVIEDLEVRRTAEAETRLSGHWSVSRYHGMVRE